MRKFFILISLIVLLFAGCDVFDTKMTVKYEVTGLIMPDSAYITMRNSNGYMVALGNINLPWSIQFDVYSGFFAEISATNNGIGILMVKIYVDGREFRSNTSLGILSNNTATAFGIVR